MSFTGLTKGSTCQRCGYALPMDFPRMPKCCQCGKTRCAQLGAATGGIALIQCHTCRGNVRKKFPIHACTVHGTCLPTYAGADTQLMTCATCQANNLGYTPIMDVNKGTHND